MSKWYNFPELKWDKEKLDSYRYFSNEEIILPEFKDKFEAAIHAIKLAESHQSNKNIIIPKSGGICLELEPSFCMLCNILNIKVYFISGCEQNNFQTNYESAYMSVTDYVSFLFPIIYDEYGCYGIQDLLYKLREDYNNFILKHE